jgi:hypothetical protein
VRGDASDGSEASACSVLVERVLRHRLLGGHGELHGRRRGDAMMWMIRCWSMRVTLLALWCLAAWAEE